MFLCFGELVVAILAPNIVLSAWIGSVQVRLTQPVVLLIGTHFNNLTQYALCFTPGLFTGRLYDMGIVKLPLGISSAALVVGTLLTAECKEYWQFLLCQGFFVGVS